MTNDENVVKCEICDEELSSDEIKICENADKYICEACSEHMEAELEGYIKGPKWCGLKRALWASAKNLDLELEITDHDKGWLTETIYYKVTGKVENVKAFSDWTNSLNRR